MELNELLRYRLQILDESKDSDGYISDEGFVAACAPWLNETKLIESSDLEDTFCLIKESSIKVNSYLLNESGERLHLFIVDEDSLQPNAKDEKILISQKSAYEKQFGRAFNFIKKSAKKQLSNELPDGSPAWVLIHQLGSAEFIHQIDVIEIFLLTATATVETRGLEIKPKEIDFEDEKLLVNYTRAEKQWSKELIVIRRVIDLNFLYNVSIAENNRYPLVIDFSSSPFNSPLPCLYAASEKDFDSYLCAVPAALLAELYKRYSSRLLEKNVRSFLQIKGVNQRMQKTIKDTPERFIAYNNGLTITATDSEIIKTEKGVFLKSLTDFQIVNGGQTTATLYFSHKAGFAVEGIKVMAKINVAKGASEETLDDLISNISRFSNDQSRVSPVDLRARSPQLVKLKSLSESVLTVSGKKWFFERAKGEYATMLRINSSRKSQLEKAFPKERRFTKEDLAKYYSSWGDKPYAVKKGGEKIFRIFLEEIGGETKGRKESKINRSFYEDLIARMILFRGLENLYGTGSKSLGQLRSAVVPYTLSAVYTFTTGSKNGYCFDLLKIWKAEKINEELEVFFVLLMKLMNQLIKDYSESDDFGEYSKRAELWDSILDSKELKDFMNMNSTTNLLKKYCISKDEIKKREKESTKEKDLDFEPLLKIAFIHDRGDLFYKKINRVFSTSDSPSTVHRLNTIISAIQQGKSIEENIVDFEKDLIKKLLVDNPELIEDTNGTSIFSNTVHFVVKKYNDTFTNDLTIQTQFDLLMNLAAGKGIKYASVFSKIGKRLSANQLPSFEQIRNASEYCKEIKFSL